MWRYRVQYSARLHAYRVVYIRPDGQETYDALLLTSSDRAHRIGRETCAAMNARYGLTHAGV